LFRGRRAWGDLGDGLEALAIIGSASSEDVFGRERFAGGLNGEGGGFGSSGSVCLSAMILAYTKCLEILLTFISYSVKRG